MRDIVVSLDLHSLRRCKTEDDVKHLPLADIGLTTRYIEALQERGIRTVADLAGTPDRTLLEIGNVGGIAVQEMRGILQQLGTYMSRRQLRVDMEMFHDRLTSLMQNTEEHTATHAPAGTREKLEVMRSRAEMGLPLWHENDRKYYEGLTAPIKPHTVKRAAMNDRTSLF